MAAYDRYYPFNSGAGQNSMEDRWREMASNWLGNGVILDTSHVATLSSGLILSVGAGSVWINGHFGATDTAKLVGLAAAHATLPRRDVIVAKASSTANTVSMEVLTGTPASPAVRPTLAADEIPLVDILVPAAAVTLTANDIADARTVLTPNNGRPRSRNLLMNGSFRFWPRGNSSVSGGAAAWGPARWHHYRAGAVGGSTLTQQSGPPGQRYCARVQRDSGNAALNTASLVQSIPTSDSIAAVGSRVTVSFRARCGANYSPIGSLLNVFLFTGTGTDQTSFAGIAGVAVTLTAFPVLTTAWQRYTVSSDVAVAASATQLHINLGMSPTGTAGANDWFEIADVQLERGAAASAFEDVDEATERTRCGWFFKRLAGLQRIVAPLATTRVALPLPEFEFMRPGGVLSTTMTDGNYVGAIPTSTQWALAVLNLAFVTKTGTITVSPIQGTASTGGFVGFLNATFSQIPDQLVTGSALNIDYNAEV